jgi:hypothetical protein
MAMAIDEKKAILRGLSATAQQVRAEAAAPESLARAEAIRRQSDRRYRILCGPILLLPLAMSLLAVGWQEYRFYGLGLRWGSEVTFNRYWHEGILLIGTGMLLCGVGFALLWLFREVCGKPMRIAGMVGNILAGAVAIFGVFFLNFSFSQGRAAAYGRLDYAALGLAAPEIEKFRQSERMEVGSIMDESSTQWKSMPQAVRDIGPQRLVFLDHGFALELDDSGSRGEKEGLIIPQAMSEDVAGARSKKYQMDLVSHDPPVLRFRDISFDGVWLNGVLDGTAPTSAFVP